MLLDSPTLSLSESFVAHHARLRNIALKIMRSADLADEVMQDAYLKLVEVPLSSTVQKPFFYCCQVVRNLALDYYRRKSMEANYLVFGEETEELEPPEHATPEKLLSERQILAELDKVLDTLPERTRLAFELYRLGGMTQRDIGKRLGCSATLVNFMIKDAVTALASCHHLLG